MKIPDACKCGFKFSWQENDRNFGVFGTLDDRVGIVCHQCGAYYLDGVEFTDWKNLWFTTQAPRE